MSKRVTITKHDLTLIEWLVRFYKRNTSHVQYPAEQNVDELVAKLTPQPKERKL